MKKKILFVFAHPDDESFAAGGTIAKLHHLGHEVSLVCATSGCKGRSGEFQFNSREQLIMHREEELREASSILRISNLILYRFADGTLIEQDIDLLANQIKTTILDLMPDVILTFPPDGVTGHPDHIAISRATEKAVISAEDEYPSSQLPTFFYTSIPQYYDHCQDSGPNNRCLITGKVDISGYRIQKGQALRAHKSQVYSLNRAYPGVMHADYTVIGNYEYYTLVRANGQAIQPTTALNELPTIDLV
ncbi:N-acetylglucosaminyl deacetylase, LmbE family [Paenibacillus sp. yr247]|uniref:PIG-L deacetylase family protein n=1 Tax=Paenibacillus sp. yr247 TaxID=1761880 RepID=UPI00087F2E22|nr:PIG-L family deacetylase [Paenibacillus sp. yr247]SDN96768.1 N-acetylglucosaminyl deacetylase, LmbE family [Paenibacillus sp. yr247]